ncbi:LCP family protein [Yinghuangia seranimata]|uniref:LCP family protein n=1 Tax=Yinghuangia seranimata TaxID=408067 RepID=UPI00248B53C1|nr:LCP family protein [Yinghuangia seranimata]MDI2131758.1 LCP family protein [Yinghuangia seranimata]
MDDDERASGGDRAYGGDHAAYVDRAFADPPGPRDPGPGAGLNIFDTSPEPDGDADGAGDGGPGGPGTEGDTPPEHGRRKRRQRRRLRTILLTTIATMTALVVLAAVGVWWVIDHYASKVDRIENAFPKLPLDQQPPRGKGTNFVLVGLDSRSDMPTTGRNAKGPLWQEGMQRSDATMLLHLSADRKSAYVVSVPRDAWVAIPGRGDAKINAAFSWGGPPLLIDTVQRLTDIRVDHFAAIDWTGFKGLTDALGGVDVEVAHDIPAENDARAWTAGKHHMNGADALMYVRERKGLPRGDLDRVARQQNFMRAIMQKLLTGGSLKDPLGLPKLLDAVTASISVDDRMSNGDLRDLVWSLRDIRGDDVRFMTAPVSELKNINGQDAVILAPEKSAFLWTNMRADTLDIYTRRYPNDGLSDVVS